MATDVLQQCFGPEYVECWRAFVRQYPHVADRTVERLCQAIITFARDDLPLLNSHVLIGANQVIALQEELKGLRQNLQAMEAKQALAVKWTPAAPQVPASSHRGKRGASTTDGAVGKHAKSALTPFSARPFCWSHGPCKHLGVGCGDPELGHKKDATWKNQMGSTWKAYYEKQGYSLISPT